MDEQSIGMIRTVSIIFVWILGGVAGGVLSADEPDSKKIEFFEKQVRPLLVNRCYDCHGEESVESELRLDSLAGMLEGGTRGPAIVIGDPKKSLLVSAINHSDLLQMPPKEKLPRREIAVLTEWIRRGGGVAEFQADCADSEVRENRPLVHRGTKTILGVQTSEELSRTRCEE